VKICNVFVGGINLDSAPVTQNERGWYYAKRNSVGSVIAYQTSKLVDFDTLTPWVDYKKYTNGSHADNFLRGDYDIDFSFNAGKLVTCDEDVEIEYRLTVGNTYCRAHLVKNPTIKMYFWHTDGFNSNKIVKAGQPICKIKNMSGSHLHFRTKGIYTRDLILGTNSMFKKGDRVQFTAIQNIRSGSGTKYSISRSSVIGETATIIDGPRVADGYTWFDMKFDIGGSGWVAEVGKFKLFTGPIVPPVESECEKRVSILESEIEGLRIDLGASEGRVKELEPSLVDKELKLVEAEAELESLRADYDRIKGERDRFEEEKLELQRKLDELEQGRDSILKKIGDIIYKLFKGE